MSREISIVGSTGSGVGKNAARFKVDVVTAAFFGKPFVGEDEFAEDLAAGC